MRIAFCGVGALGSGAAVLCRNLEATHRYIDKDRVESKNLLAQAYVKASIGKQKAEALKAQMLNFHSVRAEAFGVCLGPDNVAALLGEADLVVDAFDNAASRRVLSAFAKERGKPLVHAAISGDGTFGVVRWEERFEPDSEDHEGQATCEGGAHLPLIGLVSATLARAIQDFVKGAERHDAMVTLGGVQRTY